MNNPNWTGFYESEIETGNIKLDDVPYPDAEWVECLSSVGLWTVAKPDRTNVKSGLSTFETPIEKNSNWFDIILASQNLIERVKDCQHTPVSGFEFNETRATIRFFMDS